MSDTFEPFEECCDLCDAFTDDYHLLPESGRLLCQSCINELLGQMRLLTGTSTEEGE